MRALPGDVFVAGQVTPAQMQALAEQGVASIIINRPDMEGPMQPTSEEVGEAAQALGLECAYIPMSSGLSAELIDASVAAYRDLPRPIVAFCASGTRSSALWAFAHVEKLGVDVALAAVEGAGYNLAQIRSPLEDYLSSKTQ